MDLMQANTEAAARQISHMTGGATTDVTEVDPSTLDTEGDARDLIAALIDAPREQVEEMLRRADGASGAMAAEHAEKNHPGELCTDIVRQIVMCATTDALITGVILGRAQGAEAGSGLTAELADLPTIEPGDAA